MQNKTELRTKFKELRKTLDIKIKSHIILEKIKLSEIYSNAQNVMLFYPTKYEVDLLDLRFGDKKIYFPKVDGENLLVCPDNNDFIKSDFNILEPTSEAVDPNILDLVIVPALAVDKNHYRLGYGGGYYDRFLAKYSKIKTLTPIFKESIIDELPKNSYDIKIDYIFSD